MRTYSASELNEILQRHKCSAREARLCGLLAAAASGFFTAIVMMCAAYSFGWLA